MNSNPFLDKQQLPDFMEVFIGSGNELFNRLDQINQDSWMISTPFTQLLGNEVRALNKIKSLPRLLNHAIGFAMGLSFQRALVRYKITLRYTHSDLAEFRSRLEVLMANSTLDLINFSTDDFWETPQVQSFWGAFQSFLQLSQANKWQQHKVAQFLSDFTAIVFMRLLEQDKALYDRLNEISTSRAFDALKTYNNRSRYRKELCNLYTEVVLNDPKGMTLDAIYVAPNFGIYQPCLQEGNFAEDYEKAFVPSSEMNYPQSIHQFLEDYIHGHETGIPIKNKKARLLLIYGYPGQGKTSFCKRLLHDVFTKVELANWREIYFLKFKDFEKPISLKNDPLDQMRKQLNDYEDINIDVKDIRKSLLVLDGLDELLMRDDLQKTDIESILKELIREIERYEGLYIIITSRYGYIRFEDFSLRHTLILQLQEFSLDQQQIWLLNYKQFYPGTRLTKERLEEINTEESYLQELTTQPILLHMIAQLDKTPELDGNRAVVYQKLFDQITKAPWKEDQIDALRGLKSTDLRRYIRELAFELFRSGEEYLHKSQVEALTATERFKMKLKHTSFQDILRSLMVAFYFQEVVKKNNSPRLDDDFNYAIEFLHKSLYEYLAAEKIWVTIRTSFLQRDEEGEYILEDKYEVLKQVDNLLSHRRLTEEVYQYLVDIIATAEEKHRKELAFRMKYYLPFLLRKEFVYLYDSRQQQSVTQRAINGFYGYWSILVHLQPKFRYSEQVKERTRFNYFVDLLSRSYHPLNLDCADLEGGTFSGANLRDANLVGSSLRSADLRGANLIKANLQKADLRFADLRDADLIDTNLINANLCNAFLRDVYLRNADLTRANLTDAKVITYTQLSQAKSLYLCKGIPQDILAQLQKEKPELFEKPHKDF